MAKKKLTELEKKIKYYTPSIIDYTSQTSVSYSQFNIFQTCPHRWYLKYGLNLSPFESTIHTVFGTAFHETLQHYINVMYNESGAASDRLNLESYFEERFKFNYKKEYEQTKIHFSNAVEMEEFYNDGIAIIKWIKTRRNKLFTIRNRILLGIEIPIIQELKPNVFLKGYIDFVLYDLDLNKVYIYDIKTSTRGWRDKEKKDENKTSQIILYKEYFARQYGFNVDDIEIEYFIVKRKIWEESEYSIPRVQSFKPASGKNKRLQTNERFRKFIEECFDESGKPIEKSYFKNVGEDSCKWCPFNNNFELCNKKN